MAMTSRERVMKTVSFQKPDRIPIDLGALRASGINAVLYSALKKKLGLNTPTRIHDTMSMLAELDQEVIDFLHVDVLPLEPVNIGWPRMDLSKGVKKRLFSGTEAYFPPGTNIREETDGSWVLLNKSGEPYAVMPRDGYYFDFIQTTMSTGCIDPAKFKPRDNVTDEELEKFRAEAQFLFKHTDKALLGWGAGISLLGMSALLNDNITQGALDEWYCMLMTEKETANEMMGRYVDATIKLLDLDHQAAGDCCFAWGSSDDAGTQISEVISPELFVEMIKPHYKRVYDWIHTNTNWKVFLHSCGSIFHFIPHWIDAGVDILNPVQISAANMAPENLVKHYGGKVVFWGGGCDTQKVLPLGTEEEVRAHVRHNIAIFGSGKGGYVFNQVHNIQQNVPVKNVLAMFDEAYSCFPMDSGDSSH